MIVQANSLRLPIADQTVQTCVTSPPYFGLRDYGDPAQLGQEKTPDEFVAKMVEVFREVWRVLKDDGTLWLNLGDSYATAGTRQADKGQMANRSVAKHRMSGYRPTAEGCKAKDLIGIPWMVAFALRADGWYLRSEIIWHKTNPMPESVTDRPTKAHEQIFLFSKNQKYFYDAMAIREPAKDSSIARLNQDVENQKGSDRVPGKTNGTMKAVKFGGNKAEGYGVRTKSGKDWTPTQDGEVITANKRTVWTVSTKPYKEAHFATFPPDLIEPCILAGSRVGDIVLDPFNGSGTTGAVALKHGRQYIGSELNMSYINLSKARIAKVQQVFPLQLEAA